jgi:hypothetical protein
VIILNVKESRTLIRVFMLVFLTKTYKPMRENFCRGHLLPRGRNHSYIIP